MKDIHIKAVRGIYIAPAVDFDSEIGECTIEGESFLEETSSFYAPLLDWLHEYLEKNKKMVFNIKLTYFNTSTSKWILNILNALKHYKEKGAEIVVNWFYYEDDIDMEEEIDDYVIDVGIPINKMIM